MPANFGKVAEVLPLGRGEEGVWKEKVTLEAVDRKEEGLISRRFEIIWTVGEEKGCPILLRAQVEEIK